MSTKETGNRGEMLAAIYLQQQGYEVICTNWQFLHLEIDVVARYKEFLVIVEVKTRTSAFWGEPETFVSLAKQKKLIRAAALYLDQHRLDLEVRFDVVGILGTGTDARITHIADAFQPLVK
ncbi:MAG: YraN family protein [Bacteroidetes bacterium]|nr:YraN family protein [Bacteroidota bacterium]